MKGREAFRFDGFYVGSVAASLLLAFGVELLVATAREPVAALAVKAVNFVIQTGRFDTVLLRSPSLSGIITAHSGVSGVVVLLAGIRLAAWVSSGKTQEPSKSLQL